MTVIRHRHLAVAVATGLVLTAAAGGVGYAAGSTASNVSACVGSKGRLAVQNSKGKCPKKFKKVAIAKQGPRGSTGATGATGLTGPQGPGALAVNRVFFFAGPGTPVTVGGMTYTPSCSSSGGTVTATLTVASGSGAAVFVRGVQVDGGVGETTTTNVIESSGTPSTTLSVLANGSQTHLANFPGAIVASGSTTQSMTMRMYANPTNGGGGLFTTRCSFEGVITPAA